MDNDVSRREESLYATIEEEIRLAEQFVEFKTEEVMKVEKKREEKFEVDGSLRTGQEEVLIREEIFREGKEEIPRDLTEEVSERVLRQ